MQAFAISFGVIFVAELGDKSQLMALAFATRFPAWRVLIGITIATAIIHAASVAVGEPRGEPPAHGRDHHRRRPRVPRVRGVDAAGRHPGRGRRDGRGRGGTAGAVAAIAAIGGTFLLAELGDKTMLATITLATREGVLGTWLGSTLGMVAADALAIVVGHQLGARLPERVVRIGAATLFVVFGLALLVEGAIA